MSGLTWQNGGAAILWSGLGLLILAMATGLLIHWLRGIGRLMDSGDGQGGIPAAVQRCNRCRTGSTAFKCTCDADCYAAECTGGLA